METETKTFCIPDANLDQLRAAIEKLGRKASRLGLSPITMTVGDVYEVPMIRRYGKTREATMAEVLDPECQGFIRVRVHHFVTVSGATPRLAGWTFVGTLQHLQTDDGQALNLLKTVPSFEGNLPAQYRTASATTCNHCNKSIKTRKETFIVRHDDGTFKQVGRNCTQDFLGGKDPHAVAAQLELLFQALAAGGDAEEGFGGGGRHDDSYGMLAFLAQTAACIRVDGWMSRGRARALNGEAAGY